MAEVAELEFQPKLKGSHLPGVALASPMPNSTELIAIASGVWPLVVEESQPLKT